MHMKRAGRGATLEQKRTFREIVFVAPQLILDVGLTIVPPLVSISIVLTNHASFTDLPR